MLSRREAADGQRTANLEDPRGGCASLTAAASRVFLSIPIEYPGGLLLWLPPALAILFLLCFSASFQFFACHLPQQQPVRRP
jgi:hypothetical protein